MQKKIIYFLLFIFIWTSCNDGFGPDYDTAEIKQNIGGLLICSSIHEADVHSWWYDVDYKYKDKNDSIFNIGSGRYFERKWMKNEQLFNFHQWTILKTGGTFYYDKLLVGDLKTNHWTEYEIKPEKIEQDKTWKDQNISSDLHRQPSESFIKKVDSTGEIKVVYKFAPKDRIFSFINDERIVTYQIDSTTGTPVITKVTEL